MENCTGYEGRASETRPLSCAFVCMRAERRRVEWATPVGHVGTDPQPGE